MENGQMLTFHGKQELKDQRIAQVRAHRLADQLIHGQYWENGKGCAVGCTIHSSDHAAYETELGIPRELAHLEDAIFESLPNELSMTWPERFLEAIPVGVDLLATRINSRLTLALLTDEKRGLIALVTDAYELKHLEETAELLRRGIAGEDVEAALKDLADLADRADRAYRADRADRADLADLAYRADRADLADLAYRADRADRAYLADLADRAYRADRAYLAYLADRAYLAYLADPVYRADRAYRAYLAYLADRAYLAYLADLADLAEILLEVLATSAQAATHS